MFGKPKFVSVDDFKNYWGLDLRNILRDDDNVSNQAERFLARVEDRLMNWIDNHTFRRIKYEDLHLRPCGERPVETKENHDQKTTKRKVNLTNEICSFFY